MLNIIVYVLLFGTSFCGVLALHNSGINFINSFDLASQSTPSVLLTIASIGLLLNLIAIFSAVSYRTAAIKHGKPVSNGPISIDSSGHAIPRVSSNTNVADNKLSGFIVEKPFTSRPDISLPKISDVPKV